MFFGDAADEGRGADLIAGVNRSWFRRGCCNGLLCDFFLLLRSGSGFCRGGWFCGRVAADDGYDCVDLDGFAFVGADLGENAVGCRGDFGVDFVGGDFEERLVFLYGITDFLEPLSDGAFEDGFAHLGHDYLDAGFAAGLRYLWWHLRCA